ncbi:MAG: ATP-binding protein [Acidimicrobiales bacterium]
MPRRPDTVTVLPSPRRLIEALRDVGYDFVGAVADLIDNSIAANANTVDVQVHWDGPDTWLRISDNGTGMDASTVTEALRFGSERSYRPDDLGKFGLGLKTASLSQCRQILVASRTSEQIARIEARRFDLDRIHKDDRWEVEVLASAERPKELVEPLKVGPGTVVLWTQLDRLLGFRVPNGERAQRALWEMVERLEQHLGMVFHRFIEGDVQGRRRRPLVITVNGNKIKPWNPFATEEARTQHLQVRDFDIAANGVAGVVTFDPWVLPARDRFSTDAEFNRMSGPAKWNQQQGLYIYRANRMIQSGGWSRMRAPDEHTKLARVALDFYPELDPAFGINIAKMRVTLPPQLRERLKDPIEDLIRVAKRAYNPKADAAPATRATVGGAGTGPVVVAPKPAAPPTPPSGTSPGAGPGVPTTGAGTMPGIAWPPPPLPPRRSPRAALEEAATATGDGKALERIAARLRVEDPEVARVLGW